MTIGRDPKAESSDSKAGNKNEPTIHRTCFANSKPNKSAFLMELIVGRGGFGKVWRIRHRRSGRVFAMKQLEKSTIINRKSVSAIMN